MVLEIWLRISYVIQLSLGIFVLTLPMIKKNLFYLRLASGTVFLLVMYYFISSFQNSQGHFLGFLIYWGSYILSCILFMKWLIDCSWGEAAYYALCVCAMQHIAFDMFMIVFLGTKLYILATLAFALSYIGLYLLFVKKIVVQGKIEVSKGALIPMGTIILIVWLLSVIDITVLSENNVNEHQKIIYFILDALCCIYVIWVQLTQKEKLALQMEITGINNAWHSQIKQYRITQETIESINRKCHDLKHQIKALRQLSDENQQSAFFDEIEKDIMIFDSAVETGNKALDVVLMEKGMFCSNHGIQWSCMADGSLLDFMKLEDIYAMFGNALDNAIQEVLKLSDPQQRVITVKIIQQKDLVMIQIQNYFEGELEYQEDLPVTKKMNKDIHGFGMKSIRYTAEKYNGAITVDATGGIFNLQILLPLGNG